MSITLIKNSNNAARSHSLRSPCNLYFALSFSVYIKIRGILIQFFFSCSFPFFPRLPTQWSVLFFAALYYSSYLSLSPWQMKSRLFIILPRVCLTTASRVVTTCPLLQKNLIKELILSLLRGCINAKRHQQLDRRLRVVAIWFEENRTIFWEIRIVLLFESNFVFNKFAWFRGIRARGVFLGGSVIQQTLSIRIDA